jgi:hypothetical protein
VEPPGETIATALKKSGASWDEIGDLADVRGEAELAGGRLEVV